MMQLHQSPKKNDYSPFKMSWKAACLLDDIIHSQVQKASEKIEKKTGMEKSQQARWTYALTCTVGDIYRIRSFESDTVLNIALYLGVYRIFGEPFCRFMIDPALRKAKSNNGILSQYDHFFMKTRLPFLAIAGLGIVITNAYVGWSFAAVGAVFYIASSSNGMLDKAKAKIKELVESAKTALAPAPIGQEA